MSTNVRQLAQQIAARGRNGDNTLMHIQPSEVAVLEALLGKTTRNPQTGLPEAFSWGKLLGGLGAVIAAPFTGGTSLAFLAPVLASTGAALAASALSGNKSKSAAEDESAAGSYIKQRGKEALSKYDIPIIRYGMPQGAPQQGYTPGVDPERQLVPIRQPIQFGTPGGQLTPTPPGFAEGGMTPERQDAAEIYHEAIEALTGTSETPEESINRFVQVYGEQELQKLMAELQQMQQQPDQQAASGGLIEGPGGGMDDLLMARVKGGRPILVSPKEYVVTAHDVSLLGDGNPDQGGRKLDAMVQRLRMQKTGTTKQPAKTNDRAVMPA